MSPRFFALAAAALLLSPGCGSEAPESDEPAPSVGAAPAAFNGTFRVSGRTVEVETGQGRDIEGIVVIVQEGDAYSANYELETLFPTPEGPTEAQVVGTGQGGIEGGELRGTADTQIIMAQVPGVSADFGFLPRHYGPRITSNSTTRLNDDGSLTIEIESRAAEGEKDYRATRTTVRGTRISPARTPDS